MFYHQESLNTEYHVVHPDGLTFIHLHQDDQFDIIDHYGGQMCEFALYDRQGRLQSESLKTAQPIQSVTHLERLFGQKDPLLALRLNRLGIEIEEFRGYRIFEAESQPGETLRCQNPEEEAVLVLTVPYHKMDIAGQAPSTELFVKVVRAQQNGFDARFMLPEPLGETREEFFTGRCDAKSYEVRKGEYIQIIDACGKQASDFVAFSQRDLDKGIENGINITTTRSLIGAAYPMPGLFSKYYDNNNLALVEVIQDTIGRHDTFGQACFPKYYEDAGYPGHISCTENFNRELRPYGVAPRSGWPCINLFYNTGINAQNQLYMDEPWSRPGDYVMLAAHQDLVCASTACPDDISPTNAWQPTDIYVRIYKGNQKMPRAQGYRPTAHSPTKMTQNTGFHPCTSALTENYVEYAGYWMPQRYNNQGAIQEYWACREKVVLMDLTPLRKFEITGPDAETLLNRAVTRNIQKLAIGQVVYTAMCYPTGGMVEDGTVFRMNDNHFRWVGGCDYGGEWLREKALEWNLKVWVKPSTDEIHNLALQGPLSRELLKKIIWTSPLQTKGAELGWFRFSIARLEDEHGTPIVLSRTGFSGELGYEIFCHPKDAPEVWNKVWTAGEEFGLAPMGLEALDMLRIEAGLITVQEYCDQTDPFEAGIGFTVPLKSKTVDFIGKAALIRRKEKPMRKLVGLVLEGRELGLPQDGIYEGRCQIGEITSGTFSPCLNQNIALARIDISCCEEGRMVEVGKLDGHQKRLKATIVPFPFYDPEKTRVRA